MPLIRNSEVDCFIIIRISFIFVRLNFGNKLKLLPKLSAVTMAAENTVKRI